MKKIITTITFAAVVIISFTSCKKIIDDGYASPNADVRVPVETLLPPVISSMAGNSLGHGTLNDIRHIGKYIQNWQFVNAGVLGSVNRDDQMGHYLNTDCGASVWRMHYYDIGQNLMNMIKWAGEEKKWDYVGVGKAIFAWSWLTLTDYHGEVIMKEAFNSSLITFKYDTQPEVYEYVRQLCFEALDYLSRTGDGVSPANLALGDQFFYNGDVNKWKKFVYGILARSHNHLTNKTNYNADSVIYYADKSILTVADNASVKYGYAGGLTGSANFFGPIRNNFSITTIGTTCESAVRQSAYIANLMSGLNSRFPGVSDPRAIYMLRLNKNGTFKGLTPNKGQNALAANDRPESFFGIDQSLSTTPNNGAPATDNNCRFIFTNTAPTPILTSTEIWFMKAEALYRKGAAFKSEAREAYRRAMLEDFDMLTTVYNKNIPAGREITTIIRDAYVNNPIILPSVSEFTLSHIMMQKYIALFGFGVLETWVDMRRYHYLDKEAGVQVYADFVPPPSPTDLFPDNAGKLVYRVRPRYNSEYVWNKNELIRIGADVNNYHTKEPWFVIP